MIKKGVSRSTQGKKNRAAGTRFEAKVRAHLQEMGWTISKWMNTVDFEKGIGRLVPAKRKYNPFLKALSVGTGFPDFIVFKKHGTEHYDVMAVEVKRNGYLDKKEKEICKWLIEKGIFSRVMIAKQGKKRGELELIDFKTKYGI